MFTKKKKEPKLDLNFKPKKLNKPSAISPNMSKLGQLIAKGGGM